MTVASKTGKKASAAAGAKRSSYARKPTAMQRVRAKTLAKNARKAKNRAAREAKAAGLQP